MKMRSLKTTFREIDSCRLIIMHGFTFMFNSYSSQERDNFQERLIQMASKSDVYRTHLERLHSVSYILCYVTSALPTFFRGGGGAALTQGR